jgi:AcrR family transcriptional regulator
METRTRLGREDWIDAAIDRLAADGIDAVRVELLARDLGVTKGSFYWHFKSRADLLDAVLGEWEASTDRLAEDAAEAPTPTDRIERMVRLIGAAAANPDQARRESAILAWAQTDAAVAKRVAAVEARRIASVRQLLEESGFPPADAAWWADAGYTLYAGTISRGARDPDFDPGSHEDYLTRVLDAAQALVGRDR